MRIVSKSLTFARPSIIAVGFLVATGGMGFSVTLMAADAAVTNLAGTAVTELGPGAVPSVPGTPPASSTSGVAVSNSSISGASTTVSQVSGIIQPPPAPPPAFVAPAPIVSSPLSQEDGNKSLSSLENKATDSVKNIAKNFTSSASSVTLDDLNSAKIAIAKIDVLIDLEKRMAELEKVRGEREGKSFMPVAASALSPMTPPPREETHVSERPAIGAVELRRITGSVGHNSAVLSVNGQEKVVHVGDHLSDGSLVVDITATGIELRRDGTTRHVQIKDVDVVYGRPF
jgi:hypothetical protein